jgi:hypothetical protein
LVSLPLLLLLPPLLLLPLHLLTVCRLAPHQRAGSGC